MAQRIAYDCDRCGEEISLKEKVLCRLSFCTGSQPDGAGDTDYDYKQVELCPVCTANSLIALLSEAIPKHAYDRNKAIEKWLRNPEDFISLRKALRETK